MADSYSKNSYPQQFIISDKVVDDLMDFHVTPLQHGFLQSSAAIPLIGVYSHSTLIGHILGWPVDLQKREFAISEYHIDAAIGDDFDGFVERHIYALAGSFVFVSDLPDYRRLYLDANGTLSAVFDKGARMAAATAQIMLGGDYDVRLQRDLAAACEVADAGWMTAGLTAHDGVDRLLANHYLDLDSFAVQRHWPIKQPEIEGRDAALVEEIAAEMTDMIAIVTATAKSYITLTAGNESRAILASIRETATGHNFVTIRNPADRLDHDVACEIAKRFALPHQTLELRLADEAAVAAWDRRVGHCLTGNNRSFHQTVAGLNDGFLIGGLGGEVGRCFLWSSAHPQGDITATMLVDLLKLPRVAQIVEAVEQWLSGAPNFLDAAQILDLAYLELRMSAWAYAQSYSNPEERNLHPLTSRHQFERMWSLSYDFRWNNGLILQMIEARWPELLDIPINRYGDWRDYFTTLRRAIRKPQKALAKVRQILRAKALR